VEFLVNRFSPITSYRSFQFMRLPNELVGQRQTNVNVNRRY